METVKKTTPKSGGRRLLIFLAFEIFFTCAAMPFLVFYGPFDDVKRTVVGASWSTLRHQYIAKFFLSDKAIARILGSSYAVDPTARGEQLQMMDFSSNHDEKIDVYNIDGGDFEGKLMVVHDPSRIITGYSSHMPKSGETTSQMCKRNGAVAGINAGGFLDRGWTGTGGAPVGFIVRDGKIVYNPIKNDNAKQDTVAFTKNGMLIVGKHSMAQLKKYGIKEGVTFGPPLIVNGKPTITSGDGGWGIAPRTAIGQKANGYVLLLVIDGRTINSLGATLKDAQDILLQYGAVNAANLDGGSSTTMYYEGQVINKPSDKLGERTVPTAFLVKASKGGILN